MIKKIILFTLLILICTGCFNYIEINDLVIVSGIGIDYKDNEYKVTLEVLYQNKENSDSNFEWGQIKEGTGKNLTDAFYNLTLSLERDPYYAHLKVLVISESIAKDHFSDLLDFFLRNNDIRNIFSVVVSDNISPKELLSNSSEYYPVVSERIKEILENNKYSNYISRNKNFKEISNNYISNDQNVSLSMIGVKNDNPTITKLLIFDNKKPVGYLNENEAETYSILMNNNPNVIIKHECEKDKYITVKVYKSKPKYRLYKNNFYINLNMDGEIVENNCDIDLDDINEYKKITKNITNDFNNDLNNFLDKTKNLNSDLLGINKKYYNKYRKRKKDYFMNTSYKTNVKLNLNKKGLIFEVKDYDR